MKRGTMEGHEALPWVVRRGAVAFGMAVSALGLVGLFIVLPAYLLAEGVRDAGYSWERVLIPYFLCLELLVWLAWGLGYWLGRLLCHVRGLPRFALDPGTEAGLSGASAAAAVVPAVISVGQGQGPIWLRWIFAITAVFCVVSWVDQARPGWQRRRAARNRFAARARAGLPTDVASMTAEAIAEAKDRARQPKQSEGEGTSRGRGNSPGPERG